MADRVPTEIAAQGALAVGPAACWALHLISGLPMLRWACYLRLRGIGVWESPCALAPGPPTHVPASHTFGDLQHLDQERLGGSFRGSECAAPGSLHRIIRAPPPGCRPCLAVPVPGKLSCFSPGTTVWR